MQVVSGLGAGQGQQEFTPSMPERLRSARSIRPPNKLDPSAEGIPQWDTARRKPGRWSAHLGSAAGPHQRRRRSTIAALGARPHSAVLPAKRALAQVCPSVALSLWLAET